MIYNFCDEIERRHYEEGSYHSNFKVKGLLKTLIIISLLSKAKVIS